MVEKKRTPIDMALDGVAWKVLPPPDTKDDLPYATHEGVLNIGGFSFRCYVLNDGSRVFDAEDIEKFFGLEIK